MKRVFAIFLFSLFAAVAVQAQKFALIDMEYILKNIPAYERANEQMAQQSKRWQGEIDERVGLSVRRAAHSPRGGDSRKGEGGRRSQTPLFRPQWRVVQET